MIKTLILAAAFAALATAALAMPALRSEVTVNTPIVTVGDMFDNPGILAEKALFRAPLPGTTGMVSLEAVQQAAAIVGLTDYGTDGVLRVRVARAATIVDEMMLTALIDADLASRGIAAGGVMIDITFDTPNIAFNAEAVDEPVVLVSLRYTPGNNAFAARFIIAGTDAPVDVTGRIELMVDAPHLVATRAAGAILAPEDIEMRPIPLKQADAAGVASIEQLVGKALTRQSRAGMLLRAADVTEPRVVERNAVVTVILNNGPMTLTIKGQALNAAAVGQSVQVLNAVSRKILVGIALPNGAVEISSTINVAGL
jgi:flagellar basal body P-ring formation protein FlgA